MSGHEAALSGVVTVWNRAMASWDYHAVANIYTEHALFVGSLPGVREGRSGVRDYFSSIPGRSVQFSWLNKKIVALSDNNLMVSGTVLFSQDIDGAAGELERQLTWVLERLGRGWLIALHHVSLVPPGAGKFLY